jgi:hypothetical protein
MTTRSENVRKNRLYRGAVASAFALALAAPVALATDASADPNNPAVVLEGSVSCANLGPQFQPTSLSVASNRTSNSTVLNPTGSTATYSQLSLNPVSEGAGDQATAVLTCTSTTDGLKKNKTVPVQLVRPAVGVTTTLNIL